MITYIALLRGINVSGKNSIKMEQLKQLFIDKGFEEVVTYIQSGNVVFQSKKQTAEKLKAVIKKSILEMFGFDVPVLVLELHEFKKTVNDNPFIKQKNKDALFMHLTILSQVPLPADYLKLETVQRDADEYTLIDRTLYLYCPNGYGKTKLHNACIENKLNVTATTRNWKTVNELIKLGDKN